MKTKLARSRSPRWTGSVQRHFVGVEAISGEVLVLGAPGGPASYAGVLEVGGVAYDLKSQREQERLNDLWQQILAGVTFPVQVLWRCLPLRLDAYLQRFSPPGRDEDDEARLWETLAASHVQFVRQLANRRTLLERRIYLVTRVTAQEQAGNSLKALFWPGPRRPAPAEALEQARTELAVRLSDLTHHLELLQLSACRLSGLAELSTFYQSCLSPSAAAQFPLALEQLEGIECPPQVARLQLAPATIVCPFCQSVLPGYAAFCGDCGAPLTGERGTRDLHLLEGAARVPVPAMEAAPPHKTKQRCKRPSPRSLWPRQTLFPTLADLLAPSAVELTHDALKVGEEWQQVFLVRGLPRIVEAGWLRPLLELDEPFELSFQFRPQDSVPMENMLRRKRTQLQATKLLAVGKGNLVDPHIDIALRDIDDLMLKVASGAERMFDLCWLIRVWGSTKQELADRVGKLRNVLYGRRLTAHVATYEQGPAYRSCLPQARVALEGEGLLLPSEAASTAFPFVASSLFHEDGVLVGVTPAQELIALNPWARARGVANANMVVFGPPGQGKSTLVKTLVSRLALGYQLTRQPGELGFQVFVIDPESEYSLLAAALGGQKMLLSPGSPDTINPFDLPRPRRDRVTGTEHNEDVLAVRIADLHRLIEILVAERDKEGTPGVLTQDEDSILDLALFATYAEHGITRDRSTHARPAPLMRDFARVLGDTRKWGAPAGSLLKRLQRFTEGSGSGLFSGPTTLNVRSPVVVFDTSDCRTAMQQIIAQFLISTFVWGQSFQGTIPRFLVVDEAATWMQYTGGKHALEEYTQRARKHYLSVISITQHPDTFAGSKLIGNSAIKVLLRPDPASLGQIRSLFDLSEREGQRLLRLQVGEALLIVSDERGSQRLVVKNEISELELLLAQTDPSVLAEWVRKPEYAALRALLGQMAAGGLGNLATYLNEEAAS